MSAPPPSWFPDPGRVGWLRWWDGERWTEHVQPAPAVGKPVLGRAAAEQGPRATFFGPGEPVTHAYPPVTDARYAGSPLAHLVADEVRASRSGGDVQIPAEHAAAVEALYQLRAKGGVLGAIAGVGEQLLAETMSGSVPPPRASPAPGPVVTWTAPALGPQDAVGPPRPSDRPGVEGTRGAPTAWMVGAAPVSTVPGMTSAAGRAGYRAAGAAMHGALGALVLWRLVSFIGSGALFVVVGLVVALALPHVAAPLAWTLIGMGVLTMGVGVWDLVGARRSRAREWGPVL